MAGCRVRSLIPSPSGGDGRRGMRGTAAPLQALAQRLRRDALAGPAARARAGEDLPEDGMRGDNQPFPVAVLERRQGHDRPALDRQDHRNPASPGHPAPEFGRCLGHFHEPHDRSPSSSPMRTAAASRALRRPVPCPFPHRFVRKTARPLRSLVPHRDAHRPRTPATPSCPGHAIHTKLLSRRI
jgi:hypothetical protein